VADGDQIICATEYNLLVIDYNLLIFKIAPYGQSIASDTPPRAIRMIGHMFFYLNYFFVIFWKISINK
ncbi:hypothetical protein ABTM26_19680, partial [Acinetobacter baumannii]